MDNIIFISIAFFIVGFLIISLLLFGCRIRTVVKKKSRSFHSPAKLKPKVNLDLSYSKPQESIDKSNSIENFSK